MRVVWLVLRIYSYVFEILLCLFMIALGLVGGSQLDLHGLVPWEPPVVGRWLVITAIIGIICTVLAITLWFKYLHPVWALLVLVMLFRGFIFSPYSFDRGGLFDFTQSVWLFCLSILAFAGALTVLWIRPRPKSSLID